VLAQGAWIAAHMMLILVSLIYLFKFKPFYSKLSSERGSSGMMSGGNNCGGGGGSGSGCENPPGNPDSLKKRGFVVKWGCLQARAMFGAALLALTLSLMIIISVSMVSDYKRFFF
jgi:predicted permease